MREIQIRITAADLALSGTNEASIKSIELINALALGRPEGMEVLKQLASSIELSQISIDDYGTVIVKNDELQETIKNAILNPDFSRLL